MKRVNVIIVIVLSMFLTGCASGAKVENMVYSDPPSAKDKTYDRDLKKEVRMGSVIGGKETNPLWTSQISSGAFMEALRQSLEAQGLFSETGDYELQAQMLELSQPIFGLTFTVASQIKYTLTNSKTKKIVFDEVITGKHTSTFSDSPIAIQRLRLANEGSAKANIEELMNRLALLNVPRTIASVK